MLAVDGDDDDQDLGERAFEKRRGLDSGDAGQVDVHEDNSRTEGIDFLEAFFGSFPDADTAGVGHGVDDFAKTFAKGFVVFDDGDVGDFMGFVGHFG